jgi:glycerophosphoryl diester phosphodiesterase
MQKLIIAHRGASKAAPENTIEAFERAIDMGAEWIELDIRKSSDGRLIVAHDLNTESNVFVEDVFKTLQGRVKLDIEIKEQGFEKIITGTILRYFPADQFIISSFFPASLKVIRNFYPQVKTGLVLGLDSLTHISYFLYFLFQKAEILQTVDVVVLHKYLYYFGIRNFASKLVWVWTVDSPRSIKKILKDNSTEGVVTNIPDVAVKIKNEI